MEAQKATLSILTTSIGGYDATVTTSGGHKATSIVTDSGEYLVTYVAGADQYIAWRGDKHTIIRVRVGRDVAEAALKLLALLDNSIICPLTALTK